MECPEELAGGQSPEISDLLIDISSTAASSAQ
jgi:hypothetical protein